MHEDLLGYLLGALEPDEMERVAQWLRDDPLARQELARIERLLEPLEQDSELNEPPPADLVARTLAALPPLPAVSTAASSTAYPVQQTADSLGAGLAPMHGTLEPSENSATTWIDWATGAVAAAVLLGLLLPSLAQGRFEARKAACQDQLRELGTALTQYVMRTQQNHLPAIPESGPEAFAGRYAIELSEDGLLPDPSVRWCPSMNLPDRDGLGLVNLNEMVSTDDLHQASVNRLQQIQRYIGGHYAYTLGVVDDERLRPPRYEARSSFAVMSDAPLSAIQGSRLTNELVGHSGIGINVLYEDGRVQFIPLQALDSMPDHPLLNHEQRVEAGVNVDDASLAPSWRPPFVNVRQR